MVLALMESWELSSGEIAEVTNCTPSANLSGACYDEAYAHGWDTSWVAQYLLFAELWKYSCKTAITYFKISYKIICWPLFSSHFSLVFYGSWHHAYYHFSQLFSDDDWRAKIKTTLYHHSIAGCLTSCFSLLLKASTVLIRVDPVVWDYLAGWLLILFCHTYISGVWTWLWI